MKKHIVKLGNDKKILLAYLKEDMNLSSRKAKSLLGMGILVNGKKAYGDTRLKDGDTILFEDENLNKDKTTPQKMNISILYEDDHILAVDKPPYAVVHPTKTHKEGTLANGIRYYFDEQNISEPVRFFNRIDMNTSGIVIIPKNSNVHSLMDRYSSYNMNKKYIAVVAGIPRDKNGRIDLPLSNQSDYRGKRYIDNDGSAAITEYRVLEEYNDASLMSVTIKTGRTHQIRVHLSSIGHPLLGDTLYGGDDTSIKRQALHAFELDFIHPVSKLHISIKSKLPEDILELLEKLRGEV